MLSLRSAGGGEAAAGYADRAIRGQDVPRAQGAVEGQESLDEDSPFPPVSKREDKYKRRSNFHAKVKDKKINIDRCLLVVDFLSFLQYI